MCVRACVCVCVLFDRGRDIPPSRHKLAAIGVQVAAGVTGHGFAMNVTPVREHPPPPQPRSHHGQGFKHDLLTHRVSRVIVRV